jgi:hypothetical protein
MPSYLFENDEGKTATQYYPYEEAPKIGQQVTIEGDQYKRVWSFNIDAAGIRRKVEKYPYVSRVLPRNIDGCEANSAGQPIIRSQRHEVEVAARHDMGKD